MNNKKIIIIAVSVAIIGILAVIGIFLKIGESKEPEKVEVEPLVLEIVQEEAKPEAVEQLELGAGEVWSHLSGNPVSEEVGTRRPVAVMLNNLREALPQAGIAQADIIYEMPVEASITRLMGIFENYDALEKIGSVRSCRDYYLPYALDFDSVYIHFGESIYAEAILAEGKVNNLSGLSGVGGQVFYRTDDRPAPHNAYTGVQGIQAGIEALGYRKNHEEGYQGPWDFSREKEVLIPEGKDAKTIKPGYAVNQPWFEYNLETQKYERFQYGAEQIDQLTGEQIAFDNVILQYTHWAFYDNDGLLWFDASGGGDGVYCTQGKMIDITWKEGGTVGQRKYYDGQGNELKINRGKTWVCVIQRTNVDDVIIE